MKKILISTIVMVFLLMACTVMAMGRRPPSVGVVVTIPALPSIVVMEQEPYYYHQGYHYHYTNDRWYYSKSKSGPWIDLPRSHYAKEVKYKENHWKYDKGRDQYQRDVSRGDDQRNDNRGRDQRDVSRGDDQRNDNRGQ
jgi:hypothetical protein